jgi:amino acid transporter
MSPESTPQPTSLRAQYVRNATGLVREIPLLDTMIFSASATVPLGAALAFGLFFALVSFPLANLWLGLLVVLPLDLFVWITYALLASAMPKVGGDYVYISRIVNPGLGLGANLAMWVAVVLSVGFWSVNLVALGISPSFAIIGVVTHHPWWVSTSTTLLHHTWTMGIATAAILIMCVLSVIGSRFALRAMTILYAVAFAGFLVSFIVLVFTSHSSFVSDINSFSRPYTHSSNTYQGTLSAASKGGLPLLGSAHGYSARSTIGALFTAFGFTMFTFWSAYVAAEMKGGTRRKRQLAGMAVPGLVQGVLLLLGVVVFLHVVGYNFFAAANAGYYGVPVAPYYSYFVSMTTTSSFLAIVLGLAFVGWFLPTAYTQLGMAYRQIFAWSFDGLVPERAAEVRERSHTPVIAIMIAGLLSIGAAAWDTYSANFASFFALLALLSYVSPLFTGVAAIYMYSRRRDLYDGSPADWRLRGVPVLPVAGAVCVVVNAFVIGIALYFHTEIGLTSLWKAIGYPVGIVAFGIIYYYGVRAVRRRRGYDISLTFSTIPPD